MRVDYDIQQAVRSLKFLVQALEKGWIQIDDMYSESDLVVKRCGALVEPIKAVITIKTTSLIGEVCDNASH